MTANSKGKAQDDATGPDKKPDKKISSRPRGPDLVANSLRQAYQQTVSEEIPDEMMDLLNKLG